MEVIKTYKFKLHKRKKNKNLHDLTNLSGIIWNHCIALHKRYYSIYGKSLNKFQLEKHINKISKLDKFSHFRLVANATRSDIINRIDKSYKQFFRDLKKRKRTSPPKFQKVKKYKSFSFKREGDGWKLLEGNKIRIRGRIYSYFKSREIPQNTKLLTVKRDKLGDFYIYIVVSEEIHIPSRQGKSFAGFDFGLKTFLTSDIGLEIHSPLFFKQDMENIKKLNQKLSSKVKGSNNWHKAKNNLCRAHRKISNRRRDWFYKTAHSLTDKHDAMFFEDLNIAGMKKLWGRKVSDLCFSEFMAVLEWVAMQKGVYIGKIDRWFPSTQACSECGTIPDVKIGLDIREWTCQSCGAHHDRDINAAKNIKREGTSSHKLDEVRLESNLAFVA